jgi:hypothetical protein
MKINRASLEFTSVAHSGAHTIMNKISSRFETVARVLPPAQAIHSAALNERLAALYKLSQGSNYVFASPLGPFFDRGRHHHLPRFVYFGPHTHDQSLRLAFLAGFESNDLDTALALIDFVERLGADPSLGQGLNLSFFPLIDVLGRAQEKSRDLANADWSRSAIPEVNVLEKDARARGYHGFIRLEGGGAPGVITARLQGENSDSKFDAQIELISSEDFDPYPVRWEVGQVPIADGPLAAVDNLPIRPFDLRLRLPKNWSGEQQREAVVRILEKIVSRQQALQAYRPNL